MTGIVVPHPWPRDEHEAAAIQERLRPLVDRDGPGPQRPRLVAGLDVAYGGDGEDDGADGACRVAAAVVVLDAESLTPVEEATAAGDAAFPYIPGLFAFRELPVLVEALGRLRNIPDLLLCDGQGLAHPRRFGLACHLGVITGIPSAGVAKTPFTGSYDARALGPQRGDGVPLVDAGETVGRVLRTQRGVKPVYVSVGHAIDLDTACRHVLALAPSYRLPETTRLADRLSRDALRAHG
ncbi:endonuclease V [Streptomyces sp. RB6PN25]|uniref:Endonuclease V n=1 Tax=Streptomyces humicola TaxID=2953240 RepID=A0ABT1PS64_9ACTN|nr:endonuclease V [Streptomyces humicola]MCQ4080517.1 endonuclease V [Streptomyces humicola]